MRTTNSLKVRNRVRLAAGSLVVCSVALTAQLVQAQTQSSLLTSRAELMAAAEKAEIGISGSGSRANDALTAAAIRQRLRDGDFQPGDRIVLKTYTDGQNVDTLMVRTGRVIDLPGKATLSLEGVLRSEVKDKITTEVLKYVKARQIEVIPLTRIAVLGEVARPGYFALPSDVAISEAIMAAGGPTATADIDRSTVLRGRVQIHSAEDTRNALARGLTLDQFGLNAGDEIMIGKKRDLLSGSLMPVLGALASLTAIFVAVHH